MPLLHPDLHSPTRTGPTRDHHALAAVEAVYQEEPFQLSPGRAPLSLKQAPARPRTSPARGSIPAGRLPVLVRNSNQRPAEDGSGAVADAWRPVPAALAGSGEISPLWPLAGLAVLALMMLRR